MNIRSFKLPSLRQVSGIEWDLPHNVLAKWQSGIQAADSNGDNTISILDVIGIDWWTGEGVTAKRVAAALRAIGDKDVTVLINSPGGDMFEGLAIRSLLAEHKGRVTVKVLGLAASAASVIAMAGDDIQIARAGFFMIHNAWLIAIGDRNALREIADMMEPFDAAMADLYAARTGIEVKDIVTMMDKETWIGGSAAVDQGFADALLPSDEIDDSGAQATALPSPKAARQMIEQALAKGEQMPRAKRRLLMRALHESQSEEQRGTPGAAPSGTPGAAEDAVSPAARAKLAASLALLKVRGSN
ncbi:head maturation protease, ClpP-related [Dongia sp.]|uniref:head maturation protease, ClpP-related n=1 Tax=Dongia sp. TaxID=1977262 RepID=UPI0035B064FD